MKGTPDKNKSRPGECPYRRDNYTTRLGGPETFLDDRDNAGPDRGPGGRFEVPGQSPESAATEVAEKPPLVLEEDPQHLGDREDDLTVRDV